MAEETKTTTPEAQCAAKEVGVPDVPVGEKPETAVLERESPPDPEKVQKAEEEKVAEEEEKDEDSEETKISDSASFKEESSKADELIDPEKKALDDFKLLIQEALIKHEFTNPLPPCEEPTPTPAEEEKEAHPPEKISIWGVRLLADEKSDSVLLKFLRARDFKVKEAFSMLKTVVAWRKEFKIEELLEEEESIIEGLEKVVYMHGVDKEWHPVCYNAVGEFQNKELYDNTFAEAEKRAKFMKWYIKFLEKNIRKLDFSPDGICTIVQIIDLKNSPGLILLKKDLRLATNQALQLLQDNFPEFVAKQVFINVPWWYLAYNRMISPFLTQRTKSKFVFAGSIKSTETLFKYIAPEQVPIQYGGLSKHEDQEFTTAHPAIEEILKPTCKHTVELPMTEGGTLVWEARVVGWDVCYGAEFLPSVEGGYTLIVQKTRKIGLGDEQVVSCSFKTGEAGKVVLTFDNQTSKKKKLLYRSKSKPSDE